MTRSERASHTNSPYEVCAGKAYTERASAEKKTGWRAKTHADAGQPPSRERERNPGWAGYSGDSEAGILSGISRKCRMRSGFY